MLTAFDLGWYFFDIGTVPKLVQLAVTVKGNYSLHFTGELLVTAGPPKTPIGCACYEPGIPLGVGQTLFNDVGS